MLQTELPRPASIFPCISFSGENGLLDSIKASAGDLREAEVGKSWILSCVVSSEVALLLRV